MPNFMDNTCFLPYLQNHKLNRSPAITLVLEVIQFFLCDISNLFCMDVSQVCFIIKFISMFLLFIAKLLMKILICFPKHILEELQ